MKHLEKIFLFTLWSLAVFPTKAADKDSFFIESMYHFANKSELKYQATYSYYNDYKQSTPDHVVNAKYFMKDSLYYWNLGDLEILKSKNYTTLVDHESKTLMVDKATSNQTSTISKKQFDTMLNSYDSLILKNETQNAITYRIYSRSKGITFVDITISKKTMLFSSMKIYFMDFRNGNTNKFNIRNRLEISFQNIGSLNTSDLKHFEHSNYFNVTDQYNIKPVDKLQRYEIINHLKA